MRKIGLYWHTLRHLKAIQIWYRLWFSVFKLRPVRIPRPLLRNSEFDWTCCPRSLSMTGPVTFVFLNAPKCLQFPLDWNNAELELLWKYNLHYFDDLNAETSESRLQWHAKLVERWISDNPPAEGVGWDSYPTSIRIVNWAKWCLRGNSVNKRLLGSLIIQTRWLNRRLEYHLLANHLWANAKALLFSGVIFADSESKNWLRKGEKILSQQLAIQILTDGGHFERSPMYHAIILEDVIDLVQLSEIFPGVIAKELINLCRSKMEAMLSWQSTMSHPDGEISFFNDSSLGISQNYQTLKRYAEERKGFCFLDSPQRIVNLPCSGYFKIENDCAAVIADVGELGPSFQTGHAHADTLSFEMSLFERRFIVNSGIDRYGVDKERVWQRGTAAHSTVEVDGENSSEVWSGFRVARRASPYDFSVSEEGENMSVSCSHDGYQRLPGKVVHNRQWQLSNRSLEVIDTIRGGFTKGIARFYLHPNVEITDYSDKHCTLLLGNTEIFLDIEGGTLECLPSMYRPEFGISWETSCLIVNMFNSICMSRFNWQYA